MGHDFRVCHLQDSPSLFLCRVYYDSDGNPVAYAEHLLLSGQSREALRDIVANLQAALETPILDGPWFPKWDLRARTTEVHETKPHE